MSATLEIVRAVLALSLAAAACGGSGAVAPGAPAPAVRAGPRAAPPSAPPAPEPLSRRGPSGPGEPAAAPPSAPPAPEPSSPRGPSAAEDPARWKDPRVIVLGRDKVLPLDPAPFRIRFAEQGYDKKSDYWSPCVRDFVQTQPEAARDALGEALSLFGTSCTRQPRMRVELRVPRPSRAALAQSHLGLVGALERTTCELALEAAYHGEPIHAERITLIADGVRWSSTRLDFDRGDGWEIATLPLTRSLARVVERALDARDTLLRFESATGYEDVVVGDERKQELRVMLDALDAINRP